MRKVLVLVGALALALPVVAAAQTNPPKIGVMNVLRAIVECSEGKQANEEFQKKFEAKRDELSRKQKEIETLQQQLKSQAATLNERSTGCAGQKHRSKDNRSAKVSRGCRKGIQRTTEPGFQPNRLQAGAAGSAIRQRKELHAGSGLFVSDDSVDLRRSGHRYYRRCRQALRRHAGVQHQLGSCRQTCHGGSTTESTGSQASGHYDSHTEEVGRHR